MYKSLKSDGHNVDMFDPNVNGNEIKKHKGIILKNKIKNNFYESVVIIVKHKIFYKMSKNFFLKKCKKNHYFYDFKGIFK